VGIVQGNIPQDEDGGSGIGDRRWLNVDPTAYRAKDTLPKQNLDMAPDLRAVWDHEDKPSTTYLIPNTGAPIPGATPGNTMGDLSAEHGPLRGLPDDIMSILRTARLSIMQSTDPSRIASTLKSRFDGNALLQAKTALTEVMAERGLLGKFYINASDFPECRNANSKKAQAFARRYADGARFVVAKPECGDCVHAKQNHCGVFHKQIQMQVPYTDDLADEVEKSQAARGRQATASEGQSPKDRIRAAYLAKGAGHQQEFTGRPQPSPPKMKVASAASAENMLIAIEDLTKQKREREQAVVAAKKAEPILALLRREMLKGRGPQDLISALRLSFDLRDLKLTRPQWEPLFKEAGIYGAIYTRQDSFDDCRVGADFLNKHSSPVRAIVAGDKCSSCIFSQAGRCMMYGRKLVGSLDDVVTPETVKAVIDEHQMAGRLPFTASKETWGETSTAALKAIHKAATVPQMAQVVPVRALVEREFVGNAVSRGTSTLTKREIVKTASRYLNEGLYGTQLGQALKGMFEVRDIKAAEEDLRPILAEQGLQGIFYVDPAVYEDFGKGCHEASRLHRSRLVPYVKAGSKCSSCVYQTTPGHCSVINKPLVVEPPYTDKKAQQQEILTSGAATEVSYNDLVNNGLTMMEEFEIQAGDGVIDIDPEPEKVDLPIEFGPHEINL